MLQIVILNFNSAADTIELYEKILRFSIPDFSIVIIDNDSAITDQQHLKENLPAESIIFNKKNIGYAEGNRAGIELAIEKKIPYFLLLNPDIRLSLDTITELLKTIETDTRIVAVGPRICYRSNPNLIYSDGGIVIKERNFNTSHLNYRKPTSDVTDMPLLHEVDYVNGSVFLGRTATVEKIGFMRSDLFLYFEETEWCERAKNNNFKLFVNSKAVAYHSESQKGKLYHFYMTRNRILLAKKDSNLFLPTVLDIHQNIWRNIKSSLRQGKKPSSLYYAKFRGLISGILRKER